MSAPSPRQPPKRPPAILRVPRAVVIRVRAWQIFFAGLPPTTRGILWALSAGFVFQLANAAIRALTLSMPPLQAQFLRYAAGLIPLIPLFFILGLGGLKPSSFRGHIWRSGLHTAGLVLWFIALPHMPLADMTAIGFTTPLFVLVGAAWLLREPLSLARWVAVLIGFSGVLVIVGPAFTGDGGWYSLLMLMASPVFAASFLLTKVLTRNDSTWVIVIWQTLLITLMSLPLAIPFWQTPTAGQWMLALVGGLCGTLGHYCLTRSFTAIDISATQSVKFVDLLWAALLGWLAFGDILRPSTVLGGAIIIATIVVLARYEARRPTP